ncbi:hypothetical protein LTR09_004896 [Extremus antarcticus]|uniref:F-box domain-containing protein n=1 Tax=Extremus antarcticus TaxID=702011 RepID=A0AAJ0DHC5_9PEZI|nr:hypothetical protein LTR09_004896 [Extremus antarcticus]
MAAAQTVFDVYELLENIIIQVPQRDIRKARNVCREWRMLIDRSIPIKKARCLNVIVGDGDDLEEARFRKNAWSMRGDSNAQMLFHFDHDLGGGRAVSSARIHMFVPARLSPLVRAPIGRTLAEIYYGYITDFLHADFGDNGAQYFCEPPVSIAYLELKDEHNRIRHPGYPKVKWCSAFCSLRVSTGVTIKDLVDCATLMLGSSSFPDLQHSVFVTPYLGKIWTGSTWF